MKHRTWTVMINMAYSDGPRTCGGDQGGPPDHSVPASWISQLAGVDMRPFQEGDYFVTDNQGCQAHCCGFCGVIARCSR